MPKGGRRAGAGRKPGIRTKVRTQAVRIAMEAAAAAMTPVDYMLSVMRDENADRERRDRMAAAVAPFVHPRLSSVEARVDVTHLLPEDLLEARLASAFDRLDQLLPSAAIGAVIEGEVLDDVTDVGDDGATNGSDDAAQPSLFDALVDAVDEKWERGK